MAYNICYVLFIIHRSENCMTSWKNLYCRALDHRLHRYESRKQFGKFRGDIGSIKQAAWLPFQRNSKHQPQKKKNEPFYREMHLKIPISSLDLTINYRCDDEKKISWVGATSWYHSVDEDSRIPKMPATNPLQALVHPQTQINYPVWIVNPQPQLLRIHLFS